MDLLSLRDLPLALAFGIVCLWLYNQANLLHAKQLIALTEAFGKEFKELTLKYDKALLDMQEERRQWVMDQRADKEILLNRLNSNTEALTNHANQIRTFANSLNPISILAERINRESTAPRRRGAATAGDDSN